MQVISGSAGTGAYMNTDQDTTYAIGGSASSITYSITIQAEAVPFSGFTYDYTGGVLTLSISTTDATRWATGSSHTGTIMASTGEVTNFSLNFCYVAAPDPLFT